MCQGRLIQRVRMKKRAAAGGWGTEKVNSSRPLTIMREPGVMGAGDHEAGSLAVSMTG